ncbi:hypothetical protein A2154_02005 [Candidatus Gottesmanbacteria bacterium RBG_16_43_7]|uniref:F0F1 ATP synthase subunit n=1 Tax=Candidatus Gottesmanbacteria bacterium RBG_16_43_7 TaxID=1798373 RepID=A0A1F5Z978_9BACT|nr:MAG: hypothetical protein A2154_02005 [Candidatus Gottesmanbacteria bacterium RBG_16_43_7]
MGRSDGVNNVDEDELYFVKTDKKSVNRTKDLSETWYYLSVFGQIGFTIALPIAGGAILGNRIDRAYGTYPTWTLILLVTGFILSILYFIKSILSVLKNLNQK